MDSIALIKLPCTFQAASLAFPAAGRPETVSLRMTWYSRLPAGASLCGSPPDRSRQLTTCAWPGAGGAEVARLER